MLPKLEYYPVNWVDGMKISRKHFTDFEHFVSDHLRDSMASGLTTYNYGLLPSEQPDFNLQVIIDQSQNVRLQLTNCRAVTGAGCRIELVNSQVELATSLQDILTKYNIPMADELHFLVVLSVDLFARKAHGMPSANELPPRPPYTIPTYRFSIVPRHQYNAHMDPRSNYKSEQFESFHLIVGQLICKYGILVNDDNYIPACAAITSHSALRNWADNTYKLLAEVQRDAFLVVNKVCEKRGTEQARKAGPLAELIRDLAEQLAAGLDDSLNLYRFTGLEQPPIHWLQAITLATRRFKTALNCLNDPALSGSVRMGRDITLKYFQDWTGITSDQLMARDIEQVINFSYDHTDISPYLDVITACWEDIYKIFRQLSQLEYIGQQPQEKHIRYDSVVTDKKDMPTNPLDVPVGGGYRPRMTGR
ncbi:hypothetical protein GCM10028807_60560 [Spirosoma daeguense]